MPQCEGCGAEVESPRETARVPGYRETVVLAFCGDCVHDEEP